MAKEFRVLWIVNRFPNSINPTEGIYHKNLVDALIVNQINVDILVPIPCVPYMLRNITKKFWNYSNYPQISEYKSVTIYYPRFLSYPNHRFLGLTHKLMFYSFNKNIKKYDLIHAHMGYPFGSLALELSKYWKIPYVLTYHGSDALIYPEINFICKKRFIRETKNASKIITVSENISNKIKEKYNIDSIFLPIGIDLTNQINNNNKSYLRDRYNLPKDKFIILFVGNYIKLKGIIDLIKVSATMSDTDKDVQFVTIGNGVLKELINKNSEIIDLGTKMNNEVLEIMAASNVLILPSYSEGMPTVLVEAGFVGLPIIASDVGDIPKFLNYGKRGHIYESGNVEALRSNIIKLKSDYNSAIQKAQRLKKYIYEYFDNTKNVKKIITLYHNVYREQNEKKSTNYTRKDTSV